MAKIISSSIRPRSSGFASGQSSLAMENFDKTRRSHNKLAHVIARSTLHTPLAQERLTQQLANDVLSTQSLSPSIARTLTTTIERIVHGELTPLYAVPDLPPPGDPLAAHDTRIEVTRRLQYFQQEADYLAGFVEKLRQLLLVLVRSFPQRRQDGALSITAPLYTLCADPVATIDEIVRKLSAFASDPHDPTPRPGTQLGDTVINNVLNQSRLTFEEAQKRPYRITWPTDAKAAPNELISTYLARTPLQTYLSADVDLILSPELLTEAVMVTALPGHGKTQALQSMVLRHLDNPDKPSIILMDSQGDSIRTLSRLKRFDPVRGNNLTIIDPTDPWPPALNLFGWNRDLADNLSEIQREEMLAGVIEMFTFCCEGLIGSGLTPRMRFVFQYLAIWILQIPGANLHVLINLLRDPTPYLQYTLSLSPTVQGFIEELFKEKSQYKSTRDHILARLHAVVANPLFERMFAHPENKFDIGAAMDTPGHVTIINTAKAQLKTECSALFGRFWIARIYQAIMARAFVPRSERRLCVFLCDEAHEYLAGAESTVEQLLFQSRKYTTSVHLVHQTLDQFRKAGVLGATLGVPALRFTGAISDSDANLLAKEMNTTPDFLKSVRKTSEGAEWAVFARNITPTATKTTMPFLEAEREPKMSEPVYQQFLQQNRERVGAPRTDHPTTPRFTDQPSCNDGDSY